MSGGNGLNMEIPPGNGLNPEVGETPVVETTAVETPVTLDGLGANRIWFGLTESLG